MRRIEVAALGLAVAWATGCAGTPTLPDGSGRGIVAFDRDPPAGVEVFERPEWTAGDRFVYLRAGLIRLPFRVLDGEDGGYVLEHEESGGQTLITRDLAMAGQRDPEMPGGVRVDDPPEALLHWPLWAGKRWTCHFFRKQAGQPVLPLQATYHCDGTETITVPAGTFECLRIWRRVRVAAEGQYLERTSLLWYAPEAGYFARRLENGTLVELAELYRQ